jgi:glycosyltransferase 2 family protein
MKLRFVILAALGLAVAVYLVTYVGWHQVLSTAVAVGWGGFALLCLCAVALFGVLGCAWYVLLPAASGSGPWVFVRARMVRDAVAEVLPFSQLGGIVLGVRAAILQGVAAPLATASMIVDVTAEMLAQIAYVALGVTLLAVRVPRNSQVAALTKAALIGLAVAAIATGLFLAVQRHGQRIAARLAAPLLRGGAGQAGAAVGNALDVIYHSPARVALSVALHFAAWIGSAAVAWVGFRLIGARIDLEAALAIESLVYAVRSAAVLIPNALGVQEAAYTLLVPLFGVGAEFALAASLLKRARDIAVGVPILLIWQAMEGRQALAAGSAAVSSDEAPT